MMVKAIIFLKMTVRDKYEQLCANKMDNLKEVDKFLDMIIQDYKLVESNIVIPQKEYETLINKNKVLESEKRKIEVELERYKARFTNIKSSDNVTTDNIELVRKINALEKFLWAHGYNPDTIK
jgi:hypothetical protein